MYLSIEKVSDRDLPQNGSHGCSARSVVVGVEEGAACGDIDIIDKKRRLAVGLPCLGCAESPSTQTPDAATLTLPSVLRSALKERGAVSLGSEIVIEH